MENCVILCKHRQQKVLRYLLVTCDNFNLRCIMFLKSLRHGFKCSVCCKRSLLLTPYGRHVMCCKCSPRYDKLLCSLVGIDVSMHNLVNSFKEV